VNIAIRYTDKALPVLRSCDVPAFGGSLAGIAAALSLSKAELSVIVVEPRTYLGREITATLRPWVSFSDFHAPELFKRLIETTPADPGGEIPLRLDTVKRVLEDELLENKVEILYASRAPQLHFSPAVSMPAQLISTWLVMSSLSSISLGSTGGYHPASRSNRTGWSR
jgi:hypothetical protein